MEMEDYLTALASWEEKQDVAGPSTSSTIGENARAGRKRKAENKPTPPTLPTKRMQHGEPRNFLRLATALKILLSSSIDDHQLERAGKLLQEYLLGFREVSFR